MNYIGESSRNLYLRAGEHVKDSTSDKRKEGSYMHLHAEEIHEGEMKFKFKKLRCYRTPMECQIAETMKVKLASRNGVDVLNSKAEYNRCMLPELEVILGRHKRSGRQ